MKSLVVGTEEEEEAAAEVIQGAPALRGSLSATRRRLPQAPHATTAAIPAEGRCTQTF